MALFAITHAILHLAERVDQASRDMRELFTDGD
jgi:hypothetical protein